MVTSRSEAVKGDGCRMSTSDRNVPRVRRIEMSPDVKGEFSTRCEESDLALAPRSSVWKTRPRRVFHSRVTGSITIGRRHGCAALGRLGFLGGFGSGA